MSRNFRAGAIATATVSFLALSGAATSGARAEIQAPQPVQAAALPQDPSAPRFVAQPVVQPLQTGPEMAGKAASLADLVERMPEVELAGDMKCLAEAVYFEARGEPLDGQLAVGAVVVNRTTSGRYPSDYCSVVTQRAQFSFVKGGRIPQADETSRAWLRAKAIAQIAHQDLWECEADDALYFHATYVNPRWARRKTQLARIDTHVFYR